MAAGEGLIPIWDPEPPLTNAASTGGPLRLGEPSSHVPFTEIDEALHSVDTPVEAGSVQMELRVSGGLDEGRLRAAVAEGLAHHPMARARKLADTADGHREWEITPAPDVNPIRAIDCPDGDAVAAARSELQSFSVPLVESPPLRVRLVRHPGGDIVMLNVNHAAFDGFGCLSVLRSIARAYAGRPDRPGPVDLAHARNLRLGPTPEQASGRLAGLRSFVGKARDVALPPARLAPEGGTDRPGYGFQHVALDIAATERLTRVSAPASSDDVIVAAMHMAAARWNAKHDAACKRVSVQVGINLRKPDWSHDVATNCVVPVHVSTEAHQRTSPRAVLEAVTGQRLSWRDPGMAGPRVIAESNGEHISPTAMTAPTSAVFRLAASRLVDTAVVSNLGLVDDPIGFGHDAGPILELWFSTQARMPGGLSLGTVIAAGRLHLAFRYRHPLFYDDAGRRFADCYLGELDALLNDVA